LRRAATERDAGVHQPGWQVGHRLAGALAELVTQALHQGDAVLDACRSLAVEEVRGVNRVAAGAQAVGERTDPVGESLHVVEQDHIGHLGTPNVDRWTAALWQSPDARL
jgi:hypothetical protein